MPSLPAWSLAIPPGAGTPCLVRDAHRARAVEERLAALLAASLPQGLALHLLWGIRGPGDLPFVLSNGAPPLPGDGRPAALGILASHAPPSPFLADPFDGAAFEATRRMRDEGREPELLVTGLWAAPQSGRVVAGRVWELCRVAYELRRAFGVAPRGLAILGGVRASWLERRRDPDGLAAWGRVGDAVARGVTGYGLLVERLAVDVGAPAEALATALLTTVVAEGESWEDTIACDAPAAALALVPPGAAILDAVDPASARRARLVSAQEPDAASLPRITLPRGPAPRRLLLPLRGIPPALPLAAG